jgi:hypothetical protein
MPPTLAQPLTHTQIDAASRFWAGGWESEELAQLKQAFPERYDAIRIKAIVLNTLYGTHVIAIYKVAGLLEKLLEGTRATGPLLVEELVDGIKKMPGRAYYSFVAKFGHFFVDSNLPILRGGDGRLAPRAGPIPESKALPKVLRKHRNSE